MAGEIKLNNVSIATENAGTVTINNATLGNSMVLGTNASPIANNLVFANGNGIDFSANANASGMTSEVLDDYEDGTFLPTLGDGTNFHTLVSDSKGGVYIKVGNLVTCYGITKIGTINTSVTTHNIYLPFTCYSYPGSIIANVAGAIVSRYINYPQDYLTCYITEGTNYLSIVSPKAGVYNPISFDYTAIGAVNAWFIFSITYRVA